MKRLTGGLRGWLLLAGLATLLLIGGVALAQPDALTVSWWTLDAGGGRSSGGSYTLTATIGQTDAGGHVGGSYSLDAGFWGRPADAGSGTPGLYRVYLPLVDG